MARPKGSKSPTKKAVKSASVISDGLEGVSFYLGRAYYRYIALVERALEDVGASERVRPGMGHVLFTLFEEDARLIKEIVTRTDVSPSTLTGIIKKMEKQGLIKCERDREDGRAVRVRLTPLAKSLEKRLRKAQVRVQRIMYADLSAAEILAVKKTLARMASSMREDDADSRERKKGGRR